MDLGCTRIGSPWDAVGAGTAQPLATRVSLHHRENCRSSATLDTPRVVAVCREIGNGIRFALGLEARAAPEKLGRADAFRFAMCANEIIVLPSVGSLSSI
jgi:hypothetical protein